MNIILTAVLINISLIFGLCTPFSIQKNENLKGELPKMTFMNRHIDLGKVKKGQDITFNYFFENTGNIDFTIDFVSGCDCTEIDWPAKTFKPGERGKINVIFLSAKKEKSETVEIDVLLKNLHPETKNPIFEIITYSYSFENE